MAESIEMKYAHLDPIRRAVRTSPLTNPPDPWRHVGTFAVGGLISIGFSRAHEWLVVSSHQGIGIIDCVAGTRIARDADADGYPDRYLEIMGIGPIAHEWITTAGLHGGGIPLATENGWAIEIVTLDWPEQEIILLAPGNDLYGTLHEKQSCFHRIAAESTLRATGFSYSGKTLVVATSSEVAIYSRVERAD
jgi:hypothetical protein